MLRVLGVFMVTQCWLVHGVAVCMCCSLTRHDLCVPEYVRFCAAEGGGLPLPLLLVLAKDGSTWKSRALLHKYRMMRALEE